METTVANLEPYAQSERRGRDLLVRVGGRWKLTGSSPKWADLPLDVAGTSRVVVVPDRLERWDSSLTLFLRDGARWSEEHKLGFDLAEMPVGSRQRLVRKSLVEKSDIGPADCIPNLFEEVGRITIETSKQVRGISRFVGESTLGAWRMLKQPSKFRWRDCVEEMQLCGAMALPIVGLISLLVGVIVAFQAAIQLRQFGADIFVADLVGVSVVREMGPMMAAVVVAGRTGAAFAATLGTMKVGEEIDALETFGIGPIDFLVLPRIAALFAMMPLLALYANAMGIFGGLIVSASLLKIPPSAYWIETQSIVDMSDITSGLIKSLFFGLLIAVAGCLRGLQCERSAAGIGKAATSAVVTSILLIIVADAVFSVLFHAVGL